MTYPISSDCCLNIAYIFPEINECSERWVLVITEKEVLKKSIGGAN